MASYLDNLSQGMQNTYSQMYRKPRYTQIGNTKVGSPQRISLDRMYGGQPTYSEMPTIGPPVQAPQPATSTASLPITGYSPTQYLEEAGWTETEDMGWLPETAQEGQTYEGFGGQKYVYSGGEWKPLQDFDLENVQFPEQAIQENLIAYLPEGVQAKYQKMMDNVQALSQEIQDKQQWLEQAQMNLQMLGGMENKEEREALEAQMAAVQQELDALIAERNENSEIFSNYAQDLYSQYYEEEADIANWKTQAEDLFEGLENGEYDLENLPEGNMMSDWLSNVIEQSDLTGGILGDFMTTDADGNTVLAPELQSMYDYIYDNPDTQKQFQEFNRRMAANAIAQGKSINSGVFADYYAGQMTEYAIGVGEQVASAMMNEIKDQYDYISNSIEKLISEMVGEEDAIAFADQMQTAYDAAQQDYQQFMEQMQMQMEEMSAAQFGDIFTGVLSGILNTVFSFI